MIEASTNRHDQYVIEHPIVCVSVARTERDPTKIPSDGELRPEDITAIVEMVRARLTAIARTVGGQ